MTPQTDFADFPRASAEQAAALRRDLEASGWGSDAIVHLLGEGAYAALQRGIRLPAVRAVQAVLAEDQAAGAAPTAAGVLTSLFMLGQTVTVTQLDGALRRTKTAGALAMGLVELAPDSGNSGGCQSEPGARRNAAAAETSVAEPSTPAAAPCPALNPDSRVRARVDLRPHEAHFPQTDLPSVRWWVASDLGELQTGQALKADHVLGIGGAALTLARLVPRRKVAAALDLGCGCGIQTLYLLQHVQQVVATDISARALGFTAFNVALAGIEARRLQLCQGDLLQPVAGRRFDLIVTNPPFVLTPPAVRQAGLPLMEYRDAGREILPELLSTLDTYLRPGGLALMLGNWECHRGQNWSEAVAAQLPAHSDAWVIKRETQDPIAYATLWLRDGGWSAQRDLPAFETALTAWITDFARRDVVQIVFGYLLLHRPDLASDGAPRKKWQVIEEINTPISWALGEYFARAIEVRSGLSAMSAAQVAQLHPVLAPDVTQENQLRPGQSEPTQMLLRQQTGFARTVALDATGAALVSVADGELSLAQIATAVAALTDQDASQLSAAMVQWAQALATDGFIDLLAADCASAQ